MKVLIIDNYDSFVYNLAQYVGQLGHNPIVIRNDLVDLNLVRELCPERIVVSPGPGNPSKKRDFGMTPSIIREMGMHIPILGVCLGHQGIATSFGGRVVRARSIMHGKASSIEHDQKGVYKGLNSPISAIRYHSLVIDEKTLPSSLIVSARSIDDGEIMGIRHKYYPIEGVQFHPESYGTKEGISIIYNFIKNGVSH